jgi:hypothetical protein
MRICSRKHGLSIKAEKAVGRLPRVMEQVTVHRRGRMGGALCAIGMATDGHGWAISLMGPSEGVPWSGGMREGSV